jgi:putative hydrolase of the HAD superfamily
MTKLWLIDLDDTLHDASKHILPWVNRAMTDYVAEHIGINMDDANGLRETYWSQYGATLLGLIRHHQVDAAHFLRATHPQKKQLQAWVQPNQLLAQRLFKLKGRRVLLTNAPMHYAEVVLKARGLSHCFERIISIEAMRFAGSLKPKPSRSMLHKIIARLGATPSQCALIEDSAENLRAAKALRLKTYLVHGYRKPQSRKASPYIDHRVESSLIFRANPI